MWVTLYIYEEREGGRPIPASSSTALSLVNIKQLIVLRTLDTSIVALHGCTALLYNEHIVQLLFTIITAQYSVQAFNVHI